MSVPTITIDPPQVLTHSVRVAEVSPQDFNIRAPGPKARIATLSKPRFPVWGDREVDVKDGNLVLPKDMTRMAVVNRYGRNTPVRVAFLENWGKWQGSFATTVSHDSHNLTVFGRDPADMALAANTVRTTQGGLCVVADGRVQTNVALPLAGLVSAAPLTDIARQFAELRQALDNLVEWEPPYLVFKALFGASLVCNAGPRLSDVGLVEPFAHKTLETPLLDNPQT